MKTLFKVWLTIGLMAIGFGIALLILAAASGARWSDMETFSLEESYQGVEKLDIEIVYGNVEIVKGNNFSIYAENLVDDGLQSYVSDGTWIIKENKNNYIRLFDLKIPVKGFIRFGKWDENWYPKFIITLPEDFTADNITMKIGAANVRAEMINSIEGEFVIGSGKLDINELTIDKKSRYEVGAGKWIAVLAMLNCLEELQE